MEKPQMTSFQISLSPSRRTAGRFIAKVRKSLQKAVVEEGESNGITQSDIARSIGVHRSVVSRELNGRRDITLGRVAELAWALGYQANLQLIKPEMPEGCNAPSGLARANPFTEVHHSSSASVEGKMPVSTLKMETVDA